MNIVVETINRSKGTEINGSRLITPAPEHCCCSVSQKTEPPHNNQYCALLLWCIESTSINLSVYRGANTKIGDPGCLYILNYTISRKASERKTTKKIQE
jgi:hypothetical protein